MVIQSSEITRREWFAELCAACLGTPWVQYGRVPGMGLDCVGLIAQALTWMDIPFEDSRSYYLGAYSDQYGPMVELFAKVFEPVTDGSLEIGDVIAYSIPGSPGHCRVYCGTSGTLCPQLNTYHSTVEGFRRVIHTPENPDWVDRIRALGSRARWSVWRLPSDG
jgi:hypothetical protein